MKHKCPECREETDEIYYCLPCRDKRKRVGFIPRRQMNTFFNFAEKFHGKTCIIGK